MGVLPFFLENAMQHTDSTLQFVPFSKIYDRKPYLLLQLTQENQDDWAFYCNNEDDLPVPDAEITVGIRELSDALEIYRRHQSVFKNVCIDIGICSEGYEGKLRFEELKINMLSPLQSFYTGIYFVNDWSGSQYWLDSDLYWPVDGQDLPGYLAGILAVCG